MQLKYLLLATAMGSAPTMLLAQDAPPSGDAAAPEQEVVITGTRIQRETYDTPAPTIGVSREDLLESGDSELSETLADLPQLFSTLNDATVTGNTQNSGLSAIQLRNLGDNRTLVLIDGRRTVSNSGIGNRVSLSTIPTDFIDRVEIVTGGTSSIYGSDAVAGVVNIITESRQTGFRINLRGGVSDEGGGEEFTVSGSWGARFADRRGYFLVSGTYDRDWGIRAVERDWAIRPVAYGYDFNTGTNLLETVFLNNGVPTSGDQPLSTFPPNVASDLSSFIPGGVFSGASAARDRFYRNGQLVPLGPDVQTGLPVPVGTSDNGNSGYFLPNRDGYNQRTGRSLILPRERYLAAAKLRYEFSPAVSAEAQVQYSRIYSMETREAVGIGWDSTYPVTDPVTGETVEVEYGRIPCRRATGGSAGPCNPFVPAEIRADAPTNGTGLAWDRRFDEVGGQITENDRETIRSWLSLRGQLTESWRWEASAGFGQYRQEQLRRNEINGANLTAALNAELGPDGQPRCVDPNARAAGCVPINLFGEGSITPQAAEWIRADLRQDLRIRQYNAQAFATGHLFEGPAGPVSAAIGVEYRRDSQRLRGDELSREGGTTGNAIPDFGGSISAIEAFAEVSAPLVRDRPGIELLSVDASARAAHYSIDRVGWVFSWRGGIQYAPIPDLRFRAQYARAQRAPDLAEIFSPPRGNFEAATDLCDGVTPATAGRIAAACRQDPGIQALFAQQAAAGDPQVFAQVGTNLFSPNAGNPDLKEETADTFTLGAVFNPSFLPGFTLAVDYYDIRIRDAIDAYTNTDIQLQCYDTDVPQADNPFCADITRNPNNGQIVELIQRQVNLARFDTRGIDVAANYRFDLNGLGVPGTFDLRYDATHVLDQTVEFEGVDGLVVNDLRGDLAEGAFAYRARGALAWRLGGFRLRWTTTYYGDINDSNGLRDRYRELLETLPEAEVPSYLDIGDVWEHDIFVSYDFDIASGSDLRLYAGVNNLFNSISPFLPSGTESGRLTNQNGIYDIAGRRFYAGATLRF
ncbi:TonB-dependent receptor [Sphingosinicella sp. LHD-64]|uniref:TonB-dependent receptor plug domain-containing protein n=1 Tax=Sphingosinicella sp. LHD-64 TaxID=3072139 RepID=UPI00280D53D6|nr:TonB-dependent receptor [Sphingosinicella sp. LHD-64]MDQ8756271.1 TonB-dependent receptor [Sphingosinicella sp. LHD-64]